MDEPLSTWMWGPSMWALLNMIGAASDLAPSHQSLTGKGRDEDAQILLKLFSHIQLVLPCAACQDSYSSFFKESMADMMRDGSVESFADIVDGRRIIELLYTIHNRVNDKLSMAAAEDFIESLEKTHRGLLSQEGAKTAMLNSMLAADRAKRPPLSIIQKRLFIFNRQPVNVDNTWLLLLALARRIKSAEGRSAFLLLLSCTSLSARAYPDQHTKNFAACLDAVCRSLAADSNIYEVLLDKYMQTSCGTDCLLDRKAVEARLRRMQSSQCTATSCR